MFTSNNRRLKYIKLHCPEHRQVARQNNLTFRSTPWCAKPAQYHEFNSNKDSVEDLDEFPYLKHVEIIADWESQPPPHPLPYIDTFPSTGALLSDYITVQ